jgi:hypothetical protein
MTFCDCCRGLKRTCKTNPSDRVREIVLTMHVKNPGAQAVMVSTLKRALLVITQAHPALKALV